MKTLVSSLAVIFSSVCCVQAQPNLIYHCTFDSADAVKTPAVGAASTLNDSATFQEGKVGNALYVPAKKGMVQIPFSKGVGGGAGRIAFWMKILNSSDSYVGGDPSVYNLLNEELFYNPYHSFGIAANDGAGNRGFSVRFPVNNGNIRSSLTGWTLSSPYSELFGTSDAAKDWHFYESRWNTNGLKGASGTLFELAVDGEAKITFSVSEADPVAVASQLGSSIVMVIPSAVGDNTDGSSNSPFLIDELEIWDSDERPAVVLPVVSEVTAKQHYPWCGKVDIGYTVTGATDGLVVKISVKDNDNDVTYEAKTFDVTPTATAGSHTLVWDATKDGVNKVSKNMVATVSLVVAE